MASIFYRSPGLYNFMLRALHGRSLDRRYRAIAAEIGRNQRVFEPGCGTAVLVPYLPEGCQYEGWDLNERFITYLVKRGVSARVKNILDFDGYPDCDVAVICDVLHHIVPHHERLMEKLLDRARKVIVLEPYNNAIPRLRWQLKYVPFGVLKFIDATFGDHDGFNPFEDRLEWSLTIDKQALIEQFRRFRAAKIMEIETDLLAVFEKPPKRMTL
jgi:SAM-dependent methyltransferase